MEFDITVCRTSYAFNTVRISANSLDEAKNIALDEAGNHTYNEKHADYETQEAVELLDFDDQRVADEIKETFGE